MDDIENPAALRAEFEDFERAQNERAPERDYSAHAVNPPEKPAPIKNMKEG